MTNRYTAWFSVLPAPSIWAVAFSAFDLAEGAGGGPSQTRDELCQFEQHRHFVAGEKWDGSFADWKT
jgi:hypothetical protein